MELFHWAIDRRADRGLHLYGFDHQHGIVLADLLVQWAKT